MQLLLPKTDQKSHRPCLLSAWVPREGGGGAENPATESTFTERQKAEIKWLCH